MNIKYLKYKSFKVMQYHHKNDLENYAWTIFILFSSWQTFVDIKVNLFVSWEGTLNKQGIFFFQFHKNGDINVNILHEWKESKDTNRLLRVSMTCEFINDENEFSIRNSLYLKKLQNTTKETIEEIKIKNNTTQHKQKLEQLEIKYLLCNTSTNPNNKNIRINEKYQTNRTKWNKWHEHHKWDSK